jgi:hypothetical protein
MEWPDSGTLRMKGERTKNGGKRKEKRDEGGKRDKVSLPCPCGTFFTWCGKEALEVVRQEHERAGEVGVASWDFPMKKHQQIKIITMMFSKDAMSPNESPYALFVYSFIVPLPIPSDPRSRWNCIVIRWMLLSGVLWIGSPVSI